MSHDAFLVLLPLIVFAALFALIDSRWPVLLIAVIFPLWMYTMRPATAALERVLVGIAPSWVAIDIEVAFALMTALSASVAIFALAATRRFIAGIWTAFLVLALIVAIFLGLYWSGYI